MCLYSHTKTNLGGLLHYSSGIKLNHILKESYWCPCFHWWFRPVLLNRIFHSDENDLFISSLIVMKLLVIKGYSIFKMWLKWLGYWTFFRLTFINLNINVNISGYNIRRYRFKLYKCDQHCFFDCKAFFVQWTMTLWWHLAVKNSKAMVFIF